MYPVDWGKQISVGIELVWKSPYFNLIQVSQMNETR